MNVIYFNIQRRKAEMYAFYSALETIGTIEAMLSGDPFKLLARRGLHSEESIIGKARIIWYGILNKLGSLCFCTCILNAIYKLPFVSTLAIKIKLMKNRSLFKNELTNDDGYSVILYPNRFKLKIDQNKTINVRPCLCYLAKKAILQVRRQNEEQHVLDEALQQQEEKQNSLEERLSRIESSIMKLLNQIEQIKSK